jgi:hypothetical protein
MRDLGMNTYSIVKIGSEYVVLADDQRVLKIASRRQAAKLVVNAAELLAMQSGPEAPPEPDIDQRSVISRRG